MTATTLMRRPKSPDSSLIHTDLANKVLKKITFKVGTLFFFEKYIIAELNEGINLDDIDSRELLREGLKFYDGRKFGYITHRIRPYSVNPTIYLPLSKHKNLIGIAVVSKLEISSANVTVEKQFFNGPFSHFNQLQDAIDFILKLH